MEGPDDHPDPSNKPADVALLLAGRVVAEREVQFLA